MVGEKGATGGGSSQGFSYILPFLVDVLYDVACRLLPRNDKTKGQLPTLDVEYQSMSYVYFNSVNYSKQGSNIFCSRTKGTM